MNPFTAPRARARFAAMALLLFTAAGAALRGQNVAAPPPVPCPTPALPDGPILLQSAEVRDFRDTVPDGLLYVLTGENPGAVLRLEPMGTAATQ